MEDLSERGYNLVYMRYRGTFESEGSFLEKNPSEDVVEVIDFLKNDGKIKEFFNGDIYDVKCEEIIVIGTSFGGSVGLSVASNNVGGVSYIIASPVVDFKNHGNDDNEQDLNNLKNFLIKGFPNLYRFKEEDFDRLLDGELIKLKNDRFKSNIIVIHGNKDKSVSINKVKDYCNKHKEIIFREVDMGHISISKLYGSGILGGILK